jgi:hypothetical protein
MPFTSAKSRGSIMMLPTPITPAVRKFRVEELRAPKYAASRMWPFTGKPDDAPRLKTELGLFSFQYGCWSGQAATPIGALDLFVHSVAFDVNHVARFSELIERIQRLDVEARTYLKEQAHDLLTAYPEWVLRLSGVTIDSAEPDVFALTYGYAEWPDFGLDVTFRDGVPVKHEAGD